MQADRPWMQKDSWFSSDISALASSYKCPLIMMIWYIKLILRFEHIVKHKSALNAFLSFFLIFDLLQVLQAHEKVSGSFQLLVFVFKLEYLCQFSTKYKIRDSFKIFYHDDFETTLLNLRKNGLRYFLVWWWIIIKIIYIIQ